MVIRTIQNAIVTRSIGDKEIMCDTGYIPLLKVGYPVTVWSSDVSGDTCSYFRTTEVKSIKERKDGFKVKTQNSTYIIRVERRK